MRIAGRPFAALAFAVLIAGCGGSDLSPTDEEEQAIVRTVDRYRTAIAEQDSKTICRELVQPGILADRGIARCERQFDRVLGELSEALADRDLPEIERIEVTDARVALVHVHGGDQAFRLVEVDGEWYLPVPEG